MRLDTDDADRTFLPGIVDILVGMRAGEERVAPLVFPTDGARGCAAASRGCVGKEGEAPHGSFLAWVNFGQDRVPRQGAPFGGEQLPVDLPHPAAPPPLQRRSSPRRCAAWRRR